MMAMNKQNENGKKKRDIKPEFIINPAPQYTAKKISDAQQLQLDIIAKTNFNLFEGRKIVALLEENHGMWRSVLMPLDFISLRDMENGRWHADTLYIYPEDGYQFELEELVKEQFNADEIQWIGGSDAVDMLGTTEVEDKSYVILQVWWD
ncbi:MAG TPA: hypothetical protein VN843_00850 [Anaerolineales bacterium]|nr:hypothetical protein [Anaerolineales bacterium]